MLRLHDPTHHSKRPFREMIRHILTVSTGTLASRLLGFARDAMIAALLGASPVADAFLVAFQLVNVVRRLLTEGALNAALVPAYWRVHDGDGPKAAAAFAGRVLGTIGIALVAVAILVGLAMPLVIAAIAPGFVGAPTLQLAVMIARLMLPYLAFAGPVAVMMGLLNAQHRFALTAFSPLLFNIALIAVTVVLLFARRDDARDAMLIAAAVGVAGFLQLAILGTQRGAVATPLRVTFDREMRAFFAKAIPGMAANSGPQLLIVAGAIVASTSPAAISWLYFANRLIELPLGLVGVAMGTVLLPVLTRAERDSESVLAAAQGLELAIGLALPAALGLAVLAEPIVRVLFEHGAFSARDAAATALALKGLALGLPAHVLFKALAPAFFARHDTLTPLLATLCGLATAIVLALLNSALGIAGIAASITLGAWTSTAILIWRGAPFAAPTRAAPARARLLRIIGAALIMGGLLRIAAGWIDPHFANAGSAVRLGILLAVVAAAIALYAALLGAFGIVRWSGVRRALRQNGPRDLRG
jgi:putative peptidoglycan lipid II flippase